MQFECILTHFSKGVKTPYDGVKPPFDGIKTPFDGLKMPFHIYF